MEGLPKKFKPFFTLVTVCGAIVLVWNIIHTDWDTAQLINLLVFGTLAIASESLPVALPKGGYVTVSYCIFLSSLILFPIGVTLTAMALSGLIIFGKVASEQPLFKRVFNASQYVLSLAAGYGVMNFFNSSSSQSDFKLFILYIIAATVYMAINTIIVVIALGFILCKSPWSIWVSNLRWGMPNFIALVPLGFLLALLYRNWGPLGLLLLFIPLLASRHSFQLYMDMRENYLSTVEALVQALEAKDTYTSGHSARVGKLAVAIGEAIKMSEDKIESLKYAAVLHDVGKIGVSEVILNKEEKLLDSEWEAIRSHPVIGQTIIKGIKFMFDIGQVVRHHHERYDGTGYPDRIKGEEIPLESRIIAVADTYDAITSDRSYRKGSTHEEALVELKRVAGSQLDPALVEVFCKVVTSESASRMVSAEQVQIA
ncbi:HD-GYP domain-containing protein [Desulfosporosinus metallidurans]|uniref:HD-GYP domain n=1 Tax=Desulfosporosinus metallidurans TaxID=1888891 RepID=A0A1Q8QWV2_9FIRM|nr:HD-GYP domain-containing protein [Desulfosporosinus metallidurans]OLN31819.1 HD-GYP domain [Desulfosporosinus metallidurans]